MQRRFRFMICFVFGVLVTFLNISFAFAFTPGGDWDLNDVSILYPLPSSAIDDGAMIHLSDIGRGGFLIPVRYLDKIPALSQFQNQVDERRSLRVVAFRIDPCFADSFVTCRRQIRLTWQPIVRLADGSVSTIDAALHSFYDLTTEEFSSLLDELLQIRRRHGFMSRGLALQVHPVLRAQGLNGPFAKSLKQLILKYAGDDNITKLTFMVVRGPGIFWGFGGYDIDAYGRVTQIEIPRMGSLIVNQSFVNQSQMGDDFIKAIMSPTPVEGERLDILIKGSRLVQTGIGEDEIVSALRAAHSIENPRRHNPGTMDCVSCHIAQPSLDVGERLFPALSAIARTQGTMYENADFNLSQAGSGLGVAGRYWHSRNLRAFGYFGSTPSISRRVIYESAETARLLNAYPSF